MSDELLNDIFIYNLRWLVDEKTFSDYISESFSEKFLKLRTKKLGFGTPEEIRDFKQNVPRYAKGSLIDNTFAIELKEELRKRFFRGNILGNKVDVMKDVLDISRYCVINEFKRFSGCDYNKISRPLITFITLKKNADKLRFLDNQEIKYEYFTMDYSEIKNSGPRDKRKSKPTFYSYNKLSPKFNNKLLRSNKNKNGDFYYYIPVELSFSGKTEDDVKGLLKNNKEDYQNNLALVKKRIDRINSKITNLKKKLENEPGNQKIKKKLQNSRKEKINLEEEFGAIQTRRTQELKYEENLMGERLKTNQGSVSDEYVLESNYYYKKLLERFKFRVETKLDLKLDLNDWSFCIVFSPLWCDSDIKKKANVDLLNSIGLSSEDLVDEVSPLDKKDLLSVQQTIVKNKLEKFYNFNLDKYSIDSNLLFFLKSCFEQPDIKTIEYYKSVGEINNFDVLVQAFKKFPEGGHWVKRIEKKNGIFYEKTEGPYTLEEAEKRVRILKNIMSFEDLDSANHYTFEDLVCDYDITKENESDIDKYVKPENRYTPYPGAKLFCLIKNHDDIVFFTKQNLTEKFRKFNNYAINNGMKYTSTLGYLIYFNPENETSIRKVGELREIIRTQENYSDEEFLWLLDAVTGRKNKRGKEPEIVPFKFISEFQNNGNISYEGLKLLYSFIEKYECSVERENISFENFKNAIGEPYVNSYRNQNFDVKSELSMGVVVNEEDDKPKKFRISKNYDGKYEICMHRIRKRLKDIKLISVSNIQDCTGILDIKFKNLKDRSWEISKLNLLSGDLFFNYEFRLIALILLVSKSFGVRNIILDTSLKNSECQNDIVYHYYHIFYLGYGNFQMFEELGFKIKNFYDYNELINNIKFMDLDEFFTKYRIPVNLSSFTETTTIENFCRKFIETDRCFTRDNLYIIQEISKVIEKNINLLIFADLDNIEFSSIEKHIIKDIED